MESVISSNVNTAHAKATALKSAVNRILEFHTTTLDNQTTIQGNRTAHDMIGKEDSLGKQIALAVKSSSDNLHSVALEFEAFDNAQGKALFQPNFNLLGDLK